MFVPYYMLIFISLCIYICKLFITILLETTPDFVRRNFLYIRIAIDLDNRIFFCIS